MNYIKHLNGFFELLEGDERLNAYHISLYMAIFQLWNKNRFRTPFPIAREELMHLSRIGSRNTYSKCMKQLHDWGFIEYSSNGNMHSGRKVTCTRFDIGPDTRAGAGDEIRTGTRSGTLIKNTNITNGNKQKPSEIFKNGRKKKINGNNPHHVNTDKDYSEPL